MLSFRKAANLLSAVFAYARPRRHVTFPSIERAKLVRVRIEGQGEYDDVGGSAGVVAEISEPKKIERLLAFVNARRGGYRVPVTGAPIPEVKAEIRDGEELLSVFSSGPNFFERVMFWSVRATPAEVREFLELIGVDPTRLRRPPPA